MRAGARRLTLGCALAWTVGSALVAQAGGVKAGGVQAGPDPGAVRAAEARGAAAAQAVAAARARAAAAAADAARLQAAQAMAAQNLRLTEQNEARLADQMAGLAVRRRAAQRALAAEAAALGPMLPLIARLALYPDETLLALPAPPGQAMLGLMALRAVTRTMQAEAATLRQQAAAIGALDRAMAGQAPVLLAARDQQRLQAALLDAELAAATRKASQAARAVAQAGQEAAAAAASVTSLRAAIAAVQAARAVALARAERAARHHPGRRAAVAALRAGLEAGPGLATGQAAPEAGAPVAGTMVRGFGAPTEAGPAQGVSYAPPPASHVAAPCRGSVLFAGPFRAYGRVVLLDCGRGAVFVLAGLARLAVGAAAQVSAGESLGTMPDWDPALGQARPTLYVELRRDGKAVNPVPFLGARP